MEEQLLDKLAEILEVDQVSLSDELESFDEWDSLTALSIIALADSNYNKKLTNDLLKELNIKFAFGQHSGVIHKNTNQYYLPRFALNENYGKIDRFIFSANTKPLIIENFLPNKILLKKNTIIQIQFEFFCSQFQKKIVLN